MAHDLKERATIIAALEGGDGEQAERSIQQHILDNGEELLAALTAQREPL
jgi:DNA-binding GntR family transcriptional regulator